MLKLPTILALFICFVYSTNEHHFEIEVPLSDQKIFNKHNGENKSTLQTIKGQYIEEKQSSKPCKKNKSRRLDSHDNENPELFESLPITATLEQVNAASVGDKIITSSVHGANYNYKNENNDTETDKNDAQHNCDCDSCVLEANKKVLQFESMELGSNNNPLINALSNIKIAEVADFNDNNTTPFVEVLLDKSASDDINNIPPVSVPLNINIGENVPLNTNTGESVPLNNNIGEHIPLTNAGKSLPLNNNIGENVPLNTNAGESVPLEINTDDNINPCQKGLKINTRRTKCGKINVPEKLSTKPPTRRILPGIINNPTNQELEDNKLYQDGPKLTNNEMETQKNWYDNLALPVKINNPRNRDLEDQLLYQDSPQSDATLNDESDAENRHGYFPNVKKVSNTYDIDLVHNMNVNEGPQQELPQESSVENQLTEPTKGRGIYDMKETGVMLLENARVCYACSTVSDPTCWTPDRKTTVKYCRKGHESCLTKSFKYRGKAVIVRDCGSYCVNLPSGDKNYNSCSICHTDLCNGAASINIYTGIGIIVFVGILFNTHQYL